MKEVNEAKLRALGYMTRDEFLAKFNKGLEYYLKENTYLGKDDDALHHPEDILVNVSGYVEAAYHVIVSFGVKGKAIAKEKKKNKKDKPVILKRPEVYKGEAYCVHCKEKRAFEGIIITSDSGRRMAQGSCPECGTKMNRLLKRE